MADFGGGIGGKFRKRPFRRSSTTTPYDRPPADPREIRSHHVADLTAEGRSGWLSRLVDPASRLISTGASRFFSSVLRKRLPAPPLQAPEEIRESRQDVPDLICIVPSSKLQKVEEGSDNTGIFFGNDGIAELEQLLKQKTFTRFEFERLAELLRSRTVEPSKVETEVDNEKHCNEQQKQCFNKEKESIDVSAQDNIIDQAASPAELAKAYMDSKPSSSLVSLRSQVFWEDKKLPSTPSASKSLDLSVAPRSTIRFSGIPEHTKSDYLTSRPLGRSAMSRMSRSPYFKVNSTKNDKGGEINGDGYACTSLSQWTPRSAIQSGGKQAVKRGNSVLDGDYGSVGPIRRIRQKCNLNSPSKNPQLSLSGSYLSSPLTPLTEGSTSVQKPLLLDKPSYGTRVSRASGNGISTAGITLPPQSSETARKVFQQLDKLVPSPKGKSPEVKIVDRDETPSKLTLDALHGRALRSKGEIDSAKFSSMEGGGKLGNASNSHSLTLGSSSFGRMDTVEENGHSNSDSLDVKFISEANGMKNASKSPTDANPNKKSTISVLSENASPQTKRPGFQMSAPEDSFELNDDEYNTKNIVSPLTEGKKDAKSKIAEFQSVISETAISEAASEIPRKNNIISETSASESELKIANYKEVISEKVERHMVSSSVSMAASSSMLFKETDRKAFIQPVVTEKSPGFTSAIASDACSPSQQPLPPTLPTSLLIQPALKREQTSPVFSSGSSSANIFAVSSKTVGFSDISGVKVDTGTGLAMTSSTSHATTVPAEGSNLIKVGEAQKAGDQFSSVGQSVSSGSMSSIPASFAFGASSTPPSLSNGSLGLSSPIFSVSATPSITLSENPASSNFLSGTAALGNTMQSLSSAAPVFSTVTSSQFGSGTSNACVPTPLDKSKSSVLEVEPAKTSPFIISNSTAVGTTAFPSTTSSSSTKAFTFSSNGTAPPALMTSGISSSTTNSSSTLATSSLFSGGGSSSSLVISSSFPSTGSSIFGFSGSAQPSTSFPSFACSNPHNSITTFGATGGSIFGSQLTYSAAGTSLIPESSAGQVASFCSSPAFGLSHSSSNNFGIAAVGSATSDAKTFKPSSGFPISTGVSSSAGTSSSFMPVAASQLFGSTSLTSSSSLFGSTFASSTSLSTGFSFGLPASGSGSTTSISNTSFPSTGFSFGLSTSASGSSPFTCGSSPGSAFLFSSTNPTPSSTLSTSSQPAFGLPNPPMGFSSVMSGPGNDQMNVEDNMADDTNQAPSFPTFGQPANLPAVPTFTFGSPAVQQGGTSVFQFGSQQNLSVPQNPSPFHAQGGSFSLGSGGGDKSGRKFVRVTRNKQRKK